MRRRRVAASSRGLTYFLISRRRAEIRPEQERSQVLQREGSSDVGMVARSVMGTVSRLYLERMRDPVEWHEWRWVVLERATVSSCAMAELLKVGRGFACCGKPKCNHCWTMDFEKVRTRRSRRAGDSLCWMEVGRKRWRWCRRDG